MHKTIYIDIDEEITSILDKIRDEKSSEICIVVPKNAALTQGIINLKLLKKEVTKYGKTILIATNDPQARKVIKRLEIKTQEITETDLRNDKKKEVVEKIEKIAVPKEVAVEEKALLEEQVAEKVEEHIEEMEIEKEEFATSEIGSESFFDGVVPESIMANEESFNDEKKKEAEEPNLIPPEKLRQELYGEKRMAEKKEISKGDFLGTKPNSLQETLDAEQLNKESNNTTVSIEKAAEMGRQAKTVKKMDPFKKDIIKAPGASKLATTAIPKGGKFGVARSVDFGLNQQQGYKRNNKMSSGSNFDFDIQKKSSQGEDFKVTDELNLKDFDEDRSRKAEEFFCAEKRSMEESAREMKSEVKKIEKQITERENGGGFFSRWGFAVLILFIFIGIGGFAVWGYTKYPQAEVTIYPRKKDFAKEIKITVKEGADTSGFEQGVIPGQYKEMTIKKTMKFNSTGETYATDDGKANGKVTIYNNYSTEEQSLVATTRVLSKEGKLFRLAKNITVPGMDGEKAGTAEVTVIADQPGEDFNIGSTTFTIEGFKGSPKYTKFEVKSFEPMEDGGSPDSNKKLSMISSEDIERAREKTIAALEKDLEEEVKIQLGSEMSAMFDSVEKEVTNVSSTNEVKDIVKSFSYTVEQKVKLMAFTTTDVNSVALLKMKEDVDSDYEIEESQSKIVFKKSITDFENKTMTMYLDATSVAWPKIEADRLVENIAEKKEEEIKVILLGYPSIEKIEFLVKPSWLTGIPISKEKIDVKIIK